MQLVLFLVLMEYIEPLIQCDRILKLYENTTSIIQASFFLGVVKQSPDYNNTNLAIRKLIEDDKIYERENSHYRIKGNTAQFIKDGGYKGFVQRENKKLEELSLSEQLSMKSIQSVIDTNTSIQTLNSKTDTFYEKQKSHNTIQMLLTGAIVLATIAYTVASIKTCNILKQTQTQEEHLQKIKALTDTQTLSDSLFRKSVKEVLEKP